MLENKAIRIGSFVMTLFLLVSLFACNGKQKDQSLPEATLIQEWFPNSNYAGAMFAAKDFAPKHGIKLEVKKGADTLDPVKMVISGESTFGDASADKVLIANDAGADLVIIGVVSYNSPTCFLAKESKNITTPKDFEGKKVGVLEGTNTEYVYRTLVKRMNLDTRRIKEVNAPFDLTSFITTDEYDVRPAYIYDEPVTLDQQNIKYTIIEPKNYGVRFIGTVYFTRRKTIEENHGLVQSFVNSVADGWSAAIEYPERAIELLKEYDSNVDAERELLSLKKGLSYFQGKKNRILWAEQEDWDEMVRTLIDLGVLSKDFHSSKSINNEFLFAHEALHKIEN